MNIEQLGLKLEGLSQRLSSKVVTAALLDQVRIYGLTANQESFAVQVITPQVTHLLDTC